MHVLVVGGTPHVQTPVAHIHTYIHYITYIHTYIHIYIYIDHWLNHVILYVFILHDGIPIVSCTGHRGNFPCPRHVQEAIEVHPDIHEGAEGHHILHHTWEEIHGFPYLC